MRFSFLWTLGLGLADASIIPFLGDSTVSQSYRNSGLVASFGTLGSTTTVNKGITAWLSGGTTHNFFGNVNNYGNIVISQTDFLKLFPLAGGMSSYFTGTGSLNGNVNNYAGAFISLNDFGSVSGASYYWSLNTMTNYGDIQWCGRGDTGGSTFSLTCAQSCTNNGLIDFGQYNGNFGGAFYWRNADVGTVTSINNEGAFRLTNVVFHNTQNIYGSGCWVLNSGGVLYLEDGTGAIKNPSGGPSFPGQKIVFAQDDSTIHMDTAVYARNANFGADVYGFGQNKALEFFQPIMSFSYSENILTVTFALNMKVNIRIGAGYDAKLFRSGLNTQHYGVYSAIFYDGPTPSQSVPGVCSVARGICANPETTVGVQPSASATTTAAVTTSASTTTTSPPSSSFITTTTTTAPSGTRSTTATTSTTVSTTTTTTSSTTVTSSSSTTSLVPTTTTISFSFSFSSSSTTTASSSSSNTAIPTISTTTYQSTIGGPSLPPTMTRSTLSTTSSTTASSTTTSSTTTSPTTTATTTTSTTPTTVAPSMTTTTKQLTTTTAIPTTTPASSMISTSMTLPTTTSTSTSSPTCGVVGYDRQNPAAYQHVYVEKASFVVCKSFCSSGLSFAVGDTVCLCYAASLLYNFKSDPTSIYTFYDAACPVPPSSTTSSSAAVTTTSTTTTASATTSATTTASTTTTSTAASTTTTAVMTTSSTTTPSAATSTTASATTSVITTTTSTSTSAQTTSSTSLSTSGNASPSTTSSGATGVCAGGAAPDSTYVASNGDVYGICKNTDFAGGDLSAVGGITSAGACSEACSQTAGCIAGSLLRSNGYCYLKSTRDGASANSGVDSVYKLSSGGSGPSTTGGATTTSSTSGTVSTTGSSQIASTATDPKTTTSSSQATSSQTTATSSSTSNTSSSTSAAGTTTTTGGTGPCADGAGPSSTYVASNGDVYGVCLNTDFPGGDFDSVGGITTSGGCAEACAATSGCVAGSLLRGASRCYLKSSRSPASQNMGVDSVYKISSGSGNPVSTTAATITTSAGMSTSTPTTGAGSGTTTTPGSCNCPTNTVTVTVTTTLTPTPSPKRG